jgi:general secretion pathway protein E/type IV pilus assembly protein PilB
MPLLQQLIQKGLLTEADLARIEEARAAAGSMPLHELLIERGFAKEEDVLPLLAEEFGLELMDLTTVTVEPETLLAIPVGLVHRHNLMPLSRQNGTLIVATGNPFDVYSLDELQTLTGLQVRPLPAYQDPLRRRR